LALVGRGGAVLAALLCVTEVRLGGIVVGLGGIVEVAALPEFAEHVTTKEFDFAGVINRGGFNEFGALIVEEADANGDDVAVVDIAGQKEASVILADFVLIELEADILLVGFADRLDDRVELEEVSHGEVGVLNLLEEAAGDDGVGSGGQVAGSPGEFFGLATLLLE